MPTANPANTRPEAAAIDVCVPNPYLLQRLARFAAIHEMSLSADVVTDTGEILWHRQQPVVAALFELVRGRPLRAPIESSLSIRNALLAEAVLSDCFAYMQGNPILLAIGRVRGVLDVLLRTSNQMLPTSLGLLLTLIRDQQPECYKKLLAAMVISAGLAHAEPLDERDAVALIDCALLRQVERLFLAEQEESGDRESTPTNSPPKFSPQYVCEVLGFSPLVADSLRQNHADPSDAAANRLGRLPDVADALSTILLRGAYSARYARVLHEGALHGGVAVDTGTLSAPANGRGVVTEVGVETVAANDSLRCARALVALEFFTGEFSVKIIDFVSRTLTPLIINGGLSVSGKYADLIMPVLQQIRAGRLAAQVLVDAPATVELAHIGQVALLRLQAIDKRLRCFELYDFSRWQLLEQDPQLMGKTCLLLDEAVWRLHDLARTVQRQAARLGDSADAIIAARLVDELDELDAASMAA